MKDSIEKIVQKAINEKRIVIPSKMKESFYNALIVTQTAILKELIEIRKVAEEEQKWRKFTEGDFK